MVVQRVFGCGIDRMTFKAKYERLQENEKQRLARVVRRMRLTLKLRYEAAFYQSPFAWTGEEFELYQTGLPSIEVYLLCTCLDTLAGRPDYMDFGIWREMQEGVTNLDSQAVVDLYDRYKKEYGVGKNWRELFRSLLPTTKEWLANNVVIRRSDQPLVTTGQDSDALVKALSVYFYEIWRNKFTHGSVSQQTATAEDIRETVECDGWWATPAGCAFLTLDKKKPHQMWDLSYRQGLDLATILRVIIHVVALKILGIEPTRELLTSNLRNLSRLNALYAFEAEVDGNAVTISIWQRLEEDSTGQLRSYLIHMGVPSLKSEASVMMAERYNANVRLESGLREMTLQYVSEVNQLNSAISGFNKSRPAPKDNAAKTWHSTKEFLAGQTKTPTYNAILTWPSRVEMTNLWLVIRAPCYT